MIKRILCLAVGLALGVGSIILLSGCVPLVATAGGQRELTVFAAVSLTEAFTELGKQFEATHPGVKVLFNFAGSQQLVQQLAQGAPADIFASANMRQMDEAVASGRVPAGSSRLFAENRLVVVFPDDNPAGVASLHDLAKPGLKLVLAAPAVPVGAYTLYFLEKASATVGYGATYSPTVLSNVVSYEANVRGVLSKIMLGEADAGVVYLSDVMAQTADAVSSLEIPDELNMVARYPIAPLLDARRPELAQAFIALVLSPEGQAVLVEHGFLPVEQP